LPFLSTYRSQRQLHAFTTVRSPLCPASHHSGTKTAAAKVQEDKVDIASPLCPATTLPHVIVKPLNLEGIHP